MIRHELEFLNDWYSKSNRKPLMIRGARQVGKSTLVRLFAENKNLELLELNLEILKLKSLKVLSEKPIESLTQEIESRLNKKIHKNSLIFFDEIQQSPELIPLLRYFYELQPQLAVICAGSLLEFILEDHNFSMPVGRIEFMHLGPMKFSEFLLNGEKKELLNQTLEIYPNLKSFHYDQLTEQLKKYFFTGGMPEAIQTYYNTHSPKSVRDVHHSIINTYKNDFSKYSNKKELPRIEEIFEALPLNLGRKVKYTQFSSHLDARKIKKALHLLGLAKLIHFCFHTNASGIPLNSQKDANVFKLYFLDIGLMHYLMGLNWTDLNSFNDKSLLTQGLSAEQFIAQHLAYRRGPQEEPDLYYWLRDKNSANAEVDFLITEGHKVIPVEVKSGSSGGIKSLIQFMIDKKGQSAYRLDLRDRSSKDEKVFEEISTRTSNTMADTINFNLQNLHLGLIEMLDIKSPRSNETF